MWYVRRHGEPFDPHDVYGNNPIIFSLKFNHGGILSSLPGRKYINGQVSYVDLVDSDEFSVHEVNAMITELGYSVDDAIFYHYLIPGQNLDVGLRALGNDSDVVNLLQYVRNDKVIEIYTEHGNFADDKSIPKIVSQDIMNRCRRNSLCLMECNDGGRADESRAVDIIVEQVQAVVIYDDEAVVDEVTDDEEAVRDDDDSEDLDYLVDEENLIQDVEVDMEEFRAAVDIEDDYDKYGDGELDELDDELDLDGFDSLSDEDDNTLNAACKKLRKKNKRNKDQIEPFYVGQKFSSRIEVKNIVTKHVVDTRRQLAPLRNDKKRFRVVCRGTTPVFEKGKDAFTAEKQMQSGPQMVGGSSTKSGGSNKKSKTVDPPTCPWTLHVSKNVYQGSWIVKTYIKEHTCLQTRRVNQCRVTYLAKEIEPTVAINPTIPLRALQEQLQQKMQIQFSLQKVFRAKTMASKKIEGDYRKQYQLLREYSEELIRSNPGTTVKIDVEREANPSSSTRQFRRIYICLGALKAGFLLCGRQILGLDGCFMKGPFPGQILTAVGIDSNNGIYPVAYALVEAETTESWTWFLKNLGDDLDLNSNSNFTFISDRQKGIIPAISKVFPSAEHRFCVRHIHENMKTKWRGNVYKNLLWNCATSTNLVHFEKAMKKVQDMDQGLYEWMRAIPPKHWSRAHFSGRSTSDVLLNNLCEVFNRQLIGGRDKPIITCLEYIREYLMRRMVVIHRQIARCGGPLTPNASRILNANKAHAVYYSVLWNGVNKYQVTGPTSNQCVVDVDLKSCTCRKWELTGIPCHHAVAVNWNMASNGLKVGIPETWVSEVYWLDTWKKVYAHTIDPINGMDMWESSACPTTLVPPKHHKQVGRPTKKRKKSMEEQAVEKSGKMTRKGNSVRCTICGNFGHNKRSCKGQEPAQPI